MEADLRGRRGVFLRDITQTAITVRREVQCVAQAEGNEETATKPGTLFSGSRGGNICESCPSISEWEV
jgi:hypothetical protein